MQGGRGGSMVACVDFGIVPPPPPLLLLLSLSTWCCLYKKVNE